MDKLVENFIKFNYNHNDYQIGFLYRDYTISKIYKNDDKNDDIKYYWTNYSNSNGKIEKNNLLPNNKILNACLNNFNTLKFKKVIGKKMMRFFKKSVEIQNNKSIIDIIFYSTFIIKKD